MLRYTIRRRLHPQYASSALIMGLVCSAGAAAQSAETGVAPAVEEVVVSGSRIERVGFEAPTPVTAITSEELEMKSYRNVSQMMEDYPALEPNVTTQRNSVPIGESNWDLRGLGAQRTLLLVDGRRMAPTNPLGTVDANVLPAPLIRQVEIVTGGASAAYGSDAVSGVVNVFLDSEFEGLKGDVQFGQTQHGDAQEKSASLTGGWSFAGGRGHIVASGEVLRNEGLSRQAERDWGAKGYAVLSNPNPQGPSRLVLPNTRLARMTDGGVIVSPGPLQYTQFLEGGTTAPFQRGENAGTVFMTGGDGASFSDEGNIAPEVERESAFVRAQYDFTDDFRAYAEVLYADAMAAYDISPNYDNGNLQIFADNAYLPQSVRDVMLANGMSSFRMGRTNVDLGGYNYGYVDNTTMRYAAGVEGSFGSSWRWDAYYQYSDNDYYTPLLGNRINSNWLLAVDAVVDPASGDIVCRSTLSDPGNGCVPMNVFGPNTATPEVIAYTTGTSWQDTNQRQSNAAVNLQGDPFSTWAGPVAVAVGLEYREDEIEGTSDPISQQNGFRSVNPKPLSGDVSVTEGYIETVVPLAANLPGVKSLEFNGAARLTDYSTSGEVTTWKAGMTYAINDAVRLRTTLSHDIRAPNIQELFAEGVRSLSGVIDPVTNTNVNSINITGGNPDLEPEEADTFTIGVVLEPSWLPGVRASIDYYDIEISGAISSVGWQGAIDRCYFGQLSYCASIIRDPVTNQILQVSANLFNADAVETSGVDVELLYTTPVDAIVGGFAGNLTLRLLANFADTRATISDGIANEAVGEESGVPEWRINVSATYDAGPARIGLQYRYIDDTVDDLLYVEGVDINDNQIPSSYYLSLYGTWQVRDSWQLFGRIDNLLDRDPPVTTNSIISPQTATSPYFDRLGRRFSVGLRYKF